MMTRDSNAWWWVMGGAIAAGLLSHLQTLDVLLPDAWEPAIHAVLELLAMLIATAAGVARMSPLAISAEGRTKAIRKKGKQMEKASAAAAVASVKADKAVVATSDAAAAAEVAKDVSAKAGDL